MYYQSITFVSLALRQIDNIKRLPLYLVSEVPGWIGLDHRFSTWGTTNPNRKQRFQRIQTSQLTEISNKLDQ